MPLLSTPARTMVPPLIWAIPSPFLCCQHSPFLILAAKSAISCYTFHQCHVAYQSTVQFNLRHMLLEKARLAKVRITWHGGTTVFLWRREMRMDPPCPKTTFVFLLCYLWLDCSFLSRETNKQTNKTRKAF